MNKNIQIIRIEKLEKGKRCIHFDQVEKLTLYFSEMRGLNLEEGAYISNDTYEGLLKEVVGKRAKKRALHLLEQMDRTEQQLREKLEASEYPAICIDEAIDYVKSFHYIDDERYAQTFTYYKKSKMSRQQIRQKLIQKGISRDVIADALETEYDADESTHIREILTKKQFSNETADEKAFRRMYSFLLRRGFRSSDILKEMNRTVEEY